MAEFKKRMNKAERWTREKDVGCQVQKGKMDGKEIELTMLELYLQRSWVRSFRLRHEF